MFIYDRVAVDFILERWWETKMRCGPKDATGASLQPNGTIDVSDTI